MHYPIPHEAAAAWEAHQGNRPQNAGLIFQRFVPGWVNEPEIKQAGLESVQKAATRADAGLLSAWHARWEAMAQAAQAVPFALKTDWRFITGLGRKGPLEVGFTFHRYGFPILPGSSVKGIARAYATLWEGLDEKDDDFLAIFGYAPQDAADKRPAQSGRAVFFDAVPGPAALPKLELDIMNPHYPNYYRGDADLGNWQSPNPVFFLTVAPGTEFRFAVGWRGTLNPALRAKAETWLRGGLLELGAGAKTSAGYGYFLDTSSPSGPIGQQGGAESTKQETPPPPPSGPLRTVTGTIRYDSSRAFVRLDDGSGSLLVDWKVLGITDKWAGKTPVEAQIDESEGRLRIVHLKKRNARP